MGNFGLEGKYLMRTPIHGVLGLKTPEEEANAQGIVLHPGLVLLAVPTFCN